MYLILDHVVVMRPGGFSVAIKKEIEYDKSNMFLENIVESNDNLM